MIRGHTATLLHAITHKVNIFYSAILREDLTNENPVISYATE